MFRKSCSRSQIVFRTDIFRKLTLGAPDLCVEAANIITTTNVITDHKCNKRLTRNVTKKKNNFSTISIDHFMFDNMYSRNIFVSTSDILGQLRKSSVLLKCFRKCSETFILPSDIICTIFNNNRTVISMFKYR